MQSMISEIGTLSRLSRKYFTIISHYPVKQHFHRMAAASAQKFQLVDARGDLFTCPPTNSLVHCVSKDLRMGKGIAVLFKNKFKGLDELRRQGKDVGDVAVLKRDGQFIYYLITKPHFYDKPTYNTLRASLEAMRSHCKEHEVTSLAMPQIGCGLDKLQWNKVSDVLKEVFTDTDVTITVYTL